MKYPSTPTDRIDTTRTEVAVRRGDGGSNEGAAVRFVRSQFEEPIRVLAVWRKAPYERTPQGDPVWIVEWEDEDLDDDLALQPDPALEAELAEMEAADPKLKALGDRVRDVEDHLRGKPSRIDTHERSVQRMQNAREEWKQRG